MAENVIPRTEDITRYRTFVTKVQEVKKSGGRETLEAGDFAGVLTPAPTGRVPGVVDGFFAFQKHYFSTTPHSDRPSFSNLLKNLPEKFMTSFDGFPFVQPKGGLKMQRIALLNSLSGNVLDKKMYKKLNKQPRKKVGDPEKKGDDECTSDEEPLPVAARLRSKANPEKDAIDRALTGVVNIGMFNKKK